MKHNLKFEDKLHIGEKENNNGINLKNKIVVFDNEGNFLFEKENLVVQTGRIFALEAISNMLTTANASVGGRRSILYFTIGNQGTSVGEHDVPVAPLASDVEIASPLAFATSNVNGKYVKPMIVESVTSYHGKLFDTLTNVEKWDINPGVNRVLLKYSMTVEANEARGEAISEVGIHYGRIDSGVVVDDGLFSRITFASKFLLGTNSFNIIYYIYA